MKTFFLLFLVTYFTASMRADFYLAADGGLAFLDWPRNGPYPRALALLESRIESHQSRVERFRLEMGWRFTRWVSVQASVFECGGTSNTALTEVVWQPVLPAPPRILPVPMALPPLQAVVIRSTLHRRISGFGIGPMFVWPVSSTLRCYTRQNIVRLAEKDWGYYPTINVGVDAGFTIPFEYNYRKVCYEPSFGIEWTLPARPRWSVGTEAAYFSSSLVKAASLVARASCHF